MTDDKKRPINAADLIAQLESDPSWTTARDRREEHRRRDLAAIDVALAPLLAELADAGVSVARLTELGESSGPAPVPILLKWLPKVDQPAAKAAIVAALDTPWAAPDAVEPLLREFELVAGDAEGPGWRIGSTLEHLVRPSDTRRVLTLVQDPKYGADRQCLVLALGHIGDASVVPTLIGLLADDDVCGHAVIALGEIEDDSAVPALEAVADHPREWIRDEIRVALRRIRRAR